MCSPKTKIEPKTNAMYNYVYTLKSFQIANHPKL